MAKQERRKPAKVVHLRPPQNPVGTCLGTMAYWSTEQGLGVDYPGNTGGPRRALSAVALTPEQISDCATSKRPVVLAFDGPDGMPIILGVVQEVADQRADRPAAPAGRPPMRAVVDGQEVRVLEAMERLELRCGDASLILTKDGKVLVEGAYVSVSALGVLRLRGASVDLD